MKAIVVGRQGRFMAIGALALSGALLTGCGGKTIKQGKAEDFVRSALKQPVQSVKCPSGVDAKVGKTFDCKVTDQAGNKGTVTVGITSIQGTTVGLQVQQVKPGG